MLELSRGCHWGDGPQVGAGLPPTPLDATNRPGRSLITGSPSWKPLVLFDFLAYSRGSVDAGQWWRLATASLAHLSLAHLAANVSAAALLGAALRTRLSVREALVVAAENVPGVKDVRDHLAWVDVTSGMVVGPPEEAPAEAKAS